MENRIKSLWQTSVLVILLCAFSFLSQFEFPYKLCGILLLLICAYLIVRNIRTDPISSFFGKIGFSKRIIVTLIIGIFTGGALALFCRRQFYLTLFSFKFQWFAITGAGIGACEEIIFRGYIQSQLLSFPKIFRIIFASLAHASYKCCLFLSPAVLHPVNLSLLFTATLIVGLFFGWLKEYSGSILPPAFAHIIFDICVYGDYMQAPWWVW
jgi:membrane protease YdiL (CAAX protease family)